MEFPSLLRQILSKRKTQRYTSRVYHENSYYLLVRKDKRHFLKSPEYRSCSATSYHENTIMAGFNAIGSSRWLATTVLMGSMATKSVMRQS